MVAAEFGFNLIPRQAEDAQKVNAVDHGANIGKAGPSLAQQPTADPHRI
ncbi:MAG: hypothetical protein R3F03_09565 [Opitutaceae bacterium]